MPEKENPGALAGATGGQAVKAGQASAMIPRASSGRQIPESMRAISATVALLRATLRRAKPAPIPASQRDMIAGLVGHWLRWRLRGAEAVYPGLAQLAKWGGCSTRQARSNLRQLEAWLVVASVAYAQGGRRATRLVVSGEGLFRALVLTGCNPSPELREGLRRYDLRNPEAAVHFFNWNKPLRPVQSGALTRPKTRK